MLPMTSINQNDHQQLLTLLCSFDDAYEISSQDGRGEFSEDEVASVRESYVNRFGFSYEFHEVMKALLRPIVIQKIATVEELKWALSKYGSKKAVEKEDGLVRDC